MWYIYTTLSSRVFAQQLHSYMLYLTIISLTSFEFMFADFAAIYTTTQERNSEERT